MPDDAAVAPERVAEAARCFAAGTALMRAGRPRDAADAFARAASLRPGHPDPLVNQALALASIGDPATALALLDDVVRRVPGHRAAHVNRALALRALGRLAEAEHSCRRALALDPGSLAAAIDLATLLIEQGRVADARAVAVALHARHGNDGRAMAALGRALHACGHPCEAVALLEAAAAALPDDPVHADNLANALADAGALDRSVAVHEAAITRTPGDLRIRSNALFNRNYLPDGTPDAMLERARAYGAAATAVVPVPFKRWRPRPAAAPLTVGLVSGDVRAHPVGFFLEAALTHADPRRLRFVLFPTGREADALTGRLEARCAGVHSIAGLADADAARRIHDRGVDVLLDLAGHTARNRLPVFAWRPAPVQAAWLGYFATTGLDAIDAVLVDRHVAPPGEDAFWSETLLRLPDTYLCWTPPVDAPPVAPPPMRRAGHLTFGSANNAAKLNDGVIAVWSRVLDAVPGSRLLLRAKQSGEPATRAHLAARFAAHGVGPDRLRIQPPLPRSAYLAGYDAIDIALDPFPYGGGATTIEALWMGVPLLGWRGDRMLGRAGALLCHHAELADWIAADADDLVARAVRHAADGDTLARLRRQQRDRLRRSPLLDGPRFAGALADALETLGALAAERVARASS